MPKGRLPQNVNKVPLKVSKPLELRDRIYKRGNKERLAGICLTELSQLFLCLKNFGFNEKACSKELLSFQTCYKQHHNNLTNPSAATNDKNSVSAINEMLKKTFVGKKKGV